MGERSGPIETTAGIPLAEVYDQESLSGRTPPFDSARDLGKPGEFPFTRGVHASMYRGKLWTMRQYAGFGTASESNRRYKYLLASGQTGLSVAFDLPTQMGRDADHPLARGEVGRAGVSISSIDDMHALLEGLPLDAVSTSMTINATAATLLCLYITVADERGIARAEALGDDPERHPQGVHRARYVHLSAGGVDAPRAPTRSPGAHASCRAGTPSASAATTSARRGATPCRRSPSRSPTGSPTSRRRAPPASRSTRSRRGCRSSSTPTRICWRRSPSSGRRGGSGRGSCASDSARAIRARRCCGSTRRRPGSTLTAADPLNNVARTTIEALAAVLGGAQSIHTNGYDEALALPTEASARVALRTQQILAFESGAGEVVDPLGGAYAIEALTSEIEARAEALIAEIDRRGGMVAAIEAGFPQGEIERRALAHQRAVESGARVIVGVNRFADGEPTPPLALHRTDAAIEAAQAAALARLRNTRNSTEVEQALRHLRESARAPDNLFPPLLAAVKARATLGEIADVFRDIFGEYRPA